VRAYNPQLRRSEGLHVPELMRRSRNVRLGAGGTAQRRHRIVDARGPGIEVG